MLAEAVDQAELVAAFERFAPLLTDENGAPIVLQSWQRAILPDVLGGRRETLVMLPKANGKTAFLAGVALFHTLITGEARVYVAAASRDQATLLFGYAAGYVKRSEALQERLVTRAGYRQIRSRRDGGVIQVLAADSDTSDGTGATLVAVDELHRHRSPGLYQTLRDGLGKRGGSLTTISTAGWDHESVLGQLRRAAMLLPDQERDGAYMHARSSGFALHEWSMPDGWDVHDLEKVKLCNPSEFVTVESLRERHDSPSMRPEDWERFACGRWVSAERSWLPAGAWAACCDPAAEIPDGARVFLGVDIGRKHDSSAIVVAFPHDGQVTVRAFVYDSPGAGEESQDLAVIEGKIRQLAGQYDVRECVFDPWSFTRSAQLLGDEGLTMVEFPQSHSRMVPASSRLFEAIRDKRVIHDGDPILAANVNAGVTVETDRGWRLTKRKATDKIDALIALAVAVERAESAPKRRRLQIFVTDPRTGNMVDAVAEGVREIAEARERDGQPEPATGPVIFA